jgi:hypothetical protein
MTTTSTMSWRCCFRFQGTVGVSPRGYPFAVVTMPAETLVGAAAAAVMIVSRVFGAEAIACEVLTAEELDRRARQPPCAGASGPKFAWPESDNRRDRTPELGQPRDHPTRRTARPLIGC